MIVARKKEINYLNQALNSKEAEFIVIYGRRRVGKTFLIKSVLKNLEGRFILCTGQKKAPLKVQLKHFIDSLTESYRPRLPLPELTSWDEAFKHLTILIEQDPNQRIVLFLDELPWLASRKSGILEALDYYWNQYWSTNPKVNIIVCGSNASWLINKIIYDRGGLHNRCTLELRLDPFTLAEVEEYLLSKNIQLNRMQILELYMCLGGIPYYLKYIRKGLSAAENIQQILFQEKAPLKDELTKLFSSLFSNGEHYLEIIRLIAKHKEGLSRAHLEKLTKHSLGGGRLTERLRQLQQTNFISAFVPWQKRKGEYYKVIDEFTLFYLSWLPEHENSYFTDDYWLKASTKPLYENWSGYAFEAICHKHVNQIINGMKLKTAEKISSWRYNSKNVNDPGAQIDMIIDRNDQAINLCEIKYTGQPFTVTRDYALKIMQRQAIFLKHIETNKQIFNTLISANGIVENKYAASTFDHIVTLNDLYGI